MCSPCDAGRYESGEWQQVTCQTCAAGTAQGANGQSALVSPAVWELSQQIVDKLNAITVLQGKALMLLVKVLARHVQQGLRMVLLLVYQLVYCVHLVNM